MCCLFGIMDYGLRLSGRQKAEILSVLSEECEVRGTDATGIAYNSRGRLHIYKRPLPAHKLRFQIPSDAVAVMGHTRMTTQGNAKLNFNNHPFPGRAENTRFALAHNGVLHNDLLLQEKHRLPKTKIQTDSYVAVQLIEEKDSLDLNSLKYMAEQVEGSFSFTVLDERDNLYFVKGDNPLCIYRYPKTRFLIYASTEEILTDALKKLRLPFEKPKRVEISVGEIVRISPEGIAARTEFNCDNLYRSWYYPYSAGWYWGVKAESDRTYVQELKAVAGSFGYDPDDVDTLLNQGFTPEELEDYLYCGEY